MFDPSTLKLALKDVNHVRGWLDIALLERCSALRALQYQLMVAETLCAEPDCVPLETVIGVVLIESDLNTGIEPRKWTTKILKPVAEVLQSDVQELEFPFRLHPDVQHCNNLVLAIDDAIKKVEDIDALVSLKQAIEKSVKELDNKIKIKKSEASIVHVLMTNASSKMLNESISHVVETSQSQLVVSDSYTTIQHSFSDVPTSGPVLSKLDNINKLVPRKLPSSTVIPRHEKGGRRSGCPCCDPDNLDNIVDKILFMDNPNF
jgi:hypothetical protein